MWLTREEFKQQVFERDEHCCVVCGKPAVDAHHILERRLFGLLTVPELFTGRVLNDGMFSDGGLNRDLNAYNTCLSEGYVIRPVDGFAANKHVKSVLKCVRENHVQTDQH